MPGGQESHIIKQEYRKRMEPPAVSGDEHNQQNGFRFFHTVQKGWV